MRRLIARNWNLTQTAETELTMVAFATTDDGVGLYHEETGGGDAGHLRP